MPRPYTCPYCGTPGKSVAKGYRSTKTMGLRRIRFCRACNRKFTPKHQKPPSPEAPSPEPPEQSTEDSASLDSPTANPTDSSQPTDSPLDVALNIVPLHDDPPDEAVTLASQRSANGQAEAHTGEDSEASYANPSTNYPSEDVTAGPEEEGEDEGTPVDASGPSPSPRAPHPHPPPPPPPEDGTADEGSDAAPDGQEEEAEDAR